MSDTDPITNDADIIDSRDVIARLDYLGALHELGDGLDEDERAEYLALIDLHEDGSVNIADWTYGETLVRESYFVEYAQQLAEDIGAIDRNAAWPACHIDWEAAADALRMDYTDLDFGGVTYLAR